LDLADATKKRSFKSNERPKGLELDQISAIPTLARLSPAKKAMISPSYLLMLSWLGPLEAGPPCEPPDSHAKNPPRNSIATIKTKAAMLNKAQ
jgi:hypothetical protein